MAKKKRAEESAPGSPAWMATFSDLMNLLLCFFVLLFSMSEVKQEEWEKLAASFNSSYNIFSGGGSAIDEGLLISSGVSQLNELSDYYSNMGKAEESDSETDKMDPVEQYKEQLEKSTSELYDEISDLTEQYNISDSVEVTKDTNSNFVQMSFSGAILFDSGKAEIKKDAKPILRKVGDLLKHYDGYMIKIEGHTDNIPQIGGLYKNNLSLSTARACSVYEFLLEEKNLNPYYLEASGLGEYHPVASNKTSEGQAKNRRVEIKIYNDLMNQP